MVNINIPLPTSCASCPLSVRHFGKLYCPPLNDRVGNEGKDSRCPLVDAEGGGDLISRQSLCDALDKAFADRIKMFDYDSYEKADEKTQLVCDGIMRAIDVVLGQPTVDHFADASKKGDMISRADAIDAISKIKRTDNWQAAVSMVLLGLPSAEPERKKGKWIYNSPVTMKCDQCGLVIKDGDWNRFKYCPNCCSDMRGERE